MCVRFVSVAVIVAVLVGCRSESRTSKTGSAPGEVSVAAAADLKFALDEISREFGKQNRGIRLIAERRCVRQSSSAAWVPILYRCRLSRCSPACAEDEFPDSKFEMVFKNSLGDEIAGIWFVDGA
jgi:hypothetical protein